MNYKFYAVLTGYCIQQLVQLYLTNKYVINNWLCNIINYFVTIVHPFKKMLDKFQYLFTNLGGYHFGIVFVYFLSIIIE